MREAPFGGARPPWGRAPLAALGAAAVLGAAAGCAGRAVDLGPDARVAAADTAYASGGRRVAVERFAPPGPGRHSAVLVLHPSDGAAGSGAQYVRRYAEDFARHGYVAYVVHYFDRTGDTRTDDPREDAAFPLWTAALEDAVTFAGRDAAVRPGRVGVFGFSLGAWVGLALGARDPRVGAVVGIGGGLFDALRPEVRRMPPTLLLHGRDDDVVPLARALAVDSTLARLGVPHQLVVYPGQKHALEDSADVDARARAVRFMDRELRRGGLFGRGRVAAGRP